MQQNLVLKNVIIIAILFIFNTSSFSQKNEQCLIILGAEHRYTQITNTKSSTQEVIDNINSVINKFNSDKIIYVYSIHKALSLSFKGIKTVQDSVGMIRDKRLNIVNDNIITKEEVNAFENKDLIQFLQNNKIKDVVIVGFMADYYIKESLLGGNELGYNMYFIPEAIMGKSEKNKEKVFEKLSKKGITQLSINEI